MDHEVKLINFVGRWGQPLALNFQRFAHTKTFEEAFPGGSRAFTGGPMRGLAQWLRLCCRDFGRSDPDAGFKNGADAALVQIPATGVIWKICPK